MRFAARELWGEQASPYDAVYIDLWGLISNRGTTILRRHDVALKTHGTMAVDWEQRVDMDRLRRAPGAREGAAG